MGADTEMSRLDSLPTAKLNELLNMEGVPKVTSSANGKVLTVVGGKWKAEEPSGGGATVVDVVFTAPNTYETVTCDKTLPEIITAYEAGKIIRARLCWTNGGKIFSCEDLTVTVNYDSQTGIITGYYFYTNAMVDDGEQVSQVGISYGYVDDSVDLKIIFSTYPGDPQ